MAVIGGCRSAAAEANPNVSGKDSTSSTTSTGSEGSTSDSGGSEIEGNLDATEDDQSPTLHDRTSGLVSLKVDVQHSDNTVVTLSLYCQAQRHGTASPANCKLHMCLLRYLQKSQKYLFGCWHL